MAGGAAVRTDTDDRSASPLLEHDLEYRPHDSKDVPDVEGEHPAPVGVGELLGPHERDLERHQTTHAGDEGIDAAEFGARVGNHPLDVLAVLHVTGERH